MATFELTGKIESKIGEDLYIILSEGKGHKTVLFKNEEVYASFTTIPDAMRIIRSEETTHEQTKISPETGNGKLIKKLSVGDRLVAEEEEEAKLKNGCQYYRRSHSREYSYHFEIIDKKRKFIITRTK